MSATHGRGSAECREMFARLSEYIDGELDAQVCSGIDDHMDDCPPCQAFLESLRRTVDLAKELPDEKLTDEIVREFVEAYRRARESGGA